MFGCRVLMQSAPFSGKGLGRAENGISEAIKVKVKCNKGGVSDGWIVDALFEQLLSHICHRFCLKRSTHVAPLHQVGHKEGEQFTFHWWDHVFNKASSNLQVESDQVNSKR